jgi:hypothetical protein
MLFVLQLFTKLLPVRACRAETGISSQNIFFALAAWASFMACTAVDKLAVKPASSKKGKTTSNKVGSTATVPSQ